MIGNRNKDTELRYSSNYVCTLWNKIKVYYSKLAEYKFVKNSD